MIRKDAPRRDREAATSIFVSNTTLMVANMPPFVVNVKKEDKLTDWRKEQIGIAENRREPNGLCYTIRL